MNEPINTSKTTLWRIQSRDVAFENLWWPVGYAVGSLIEAKEQLKDLEEEQQGRISRIIRQDIVTTEYIENL